MLEPGGCTRRVDVLAQPHLALERAVLDLHLLVDPARDLRPPAPGRVYQQMEIEYGPVQRQVRLAEDVDPERANARFEHGVLTVELPVVDTAPPAGRYRITVERLD